jgi:ERCC4-type nuclease
MQDVAAYIIADHRESNGANPYLGAVSDHNNAVNSKLPWKNGGGTLMPQILNNGAVGDYSIVIPSRYNPNRNIVAAIFERKTWKDLAASIKDGRSIGQHKNLVGLRDTKGCFIYYIIEGNLTYADDTPIAHIAFKNLHAKIRSMSLRGVHSFQTRDQEDTARFLVHIARDLVRLYRTEVVGFPLQEQPRAVSFKHDLTTLLDKYKTADDPDIKACMNVLTIESNKLNDTEIASPPELTPTVVGSSAILPVELTKRSESSHTDIIMQMWCAVPKVSSKTAPVLMEQINLIDLICMDDVRQINAMISNMTFTSGMRIGPARADAITSIAYNGEDPGKLSETYDAHIKIMSQIPSVSVETANQILAKIPMRSLCGQIKSCVRTDPNETKKNLRSIVNQLSIIQKRNGSKLGLNIAQKIVDVLSATPTMSELNHLV